LFIALDIAPGRLTFYITDSENSRHLSPSLCAWGEIPVRYGKVESSKLWVLRLSTQRKIGTQPEGQEAFKRGIILYTTTVALLQKIVESVGKCGVLVSNPLMYCPVKLKHGRFVLCEFKLKGNTSNAAKVPVAADISGR
jgi:hypothetical protein